MQVCVQPDSQPYAVLDDGSTRVDGVDERDTPSDAVPR